MADETNSGNLPGNEKGIDFNVFAEEEKTQPTETQTQMPAQQVPAGQTTQQTPNETTQQTPKAQPQGAVAMTQDQLRELVTSLRQPVQQDQSSSQERQLSPEEIDKRYAVVRPTIEDINTIFRGGPEGQAAFTNALHGAAHMGATIASHHLLGEMKKLQQYVETQIGPAREATEQQSMAKHTEEFYKRNQQFTKDYEPVLISVYNNLLAQNYRGTPEQVYAKVAEEATKLIRTVNPNFGAVAAQAGIPAQNVQGQPTRAAQSLPQSRMTVLPTGTGSGAGAPGNGSGQRNQAEQIFG